MGELGLGARLGAYTMGGGEGDSRAGSGSGRVGNAGADVLTVAVLGEILGEEVVEVLDEADDDPDPLGDPLVAAAPGAGSGACFRWAATPEPHPEGGPGAAGRQATDGVEALLGVALVAAAAPEAAAPVGVVGVPGPALLAAPELGGGA